MTELNVIPEALLGASGQIGGVVGRMVAAHATHAVAMAEVLPPGSDLPSINLAFALIGHGVAHETSAQLGNLALGASGMEVAESAINYTIVDNLGAAANSAAAGV